MPAQRLTLESLGGEYEQLFGSMTVNGGHTGDADAIINKIVQHKNVYEAIMQATGVPWQIIGIFHSLEGSLNFHTHLHNGDSLNARTVHVPPGRPKTGHPPFTFAESAIDALQLEGFAGRTDWGVAPTLFRLEKYNGFGYRRVHVNTPYLWSFSNHYTKGKFVEELVNGKPKSHLDPNLVSGQCGAAVLLKRMVDRGIFSFTGLPKLLDVSVDGSPQPDVSAFIHKGNSWIAPRTLVPFLPGLALLAVNMDPFRITLSYLKPGTTEPKTRKFDAQRFHDKGHVDASDMIRDFLGMDLQLDATVRPNRLMIHT
jgi:lysozyme family protein